MIRGWYTKDRTREGEVTRMARKKKKEKSKGSSPAYVNMDATIKALQTQLTDPRVARYIFSGAKGVRERVLKINFETLRNTVDRIPLINGIINTRVDQILPFTKFAGEDHQRGYQFVLNPNSEEDGDYDEKEVAQLATFIDQTGFNFDSEREDDFADFCQMVVREINTIDQLSTEIQYNRAGDAIAFWLLDGATIKRVANESDFRKNIRYIQEIDLEIYNKYTGDQLIFDYKYKRADIKHRGYGYSPIEQAIDVITTLLFGYNYIRDQLVKDRMPKGFISVMGDIGKPEMDSIRNYWYSAMSGAGGQWNIPILPSGKEGIGMDFKNLGSSNKDMEYHKTMMFVSSLIASIYSIDLAELGIKTDDSTAIIGENMAPRIENSKDRGLQATLTFVQQYVNKILRKVTTKYTFEFVGMIREDLKEKEEVRKAQLGTAMTIDELREQDDKEPFNEPWSQMVLNEQAVQIYLQSQQMEEGMEGEEGMEEEGEEPEYASMEEEMADYDPMAKSLTAFRKRTNRKVKVVRHVIK